MVASLLAAACKEWLGTPDERASFPERQAPVLVAYDSGRFSSEGVLNWGDAVDGELDLWLIAQGRA